MSNEFTPPVTYPSVTRNLPEVTKLPTVTYPQVSRERAADCSILQANWNEPRLCDGCTTRCR